MAKLVMPKAQSRKDALASSSQFLGILTTRSATTACVVGSPASPEISRKRHWNKNNGNELTRRRALHACLAELSTGIHSGAKEGRRTKGQDILFPYNEVPPRADRIPATRLP